MKFTLSIFFLTLISLVAYPQKRKLPPKDTYYLISKVDYAFPRQQGKLEVIKQDSLQQTVYQTDSSEMVVNDDSGARFFAGWDKDHPNEMMYYPLDSIVQLLFQNGLLTSDLLIQSFNSEEKFIDYKGDTIDWTRHNTSKTVIIRYVEEQEFPPYLKRKKGALFFEVAVIFKKDLEPFHLPAILDFEFYLQGDIKPTAANFERYLKTAKIKYLRYRGTQI